MAVKRVQKRPQSYKNRSRNRTTSVVIQKSDHLAAKRSRGLSAERPVNAEPAESEIGPLSSDLSLTKDSQIGANLRVCADEEDRADFDRRN